MIKNILLIVFLFGAFLSHGQFKIGLQFSPALSTNRVVTESDTLSIDSDGSGLKFAAGAIIDIELTESYFFSTGLLLVSKRAGLEAASQNLSTKEEYSLQYIQIPLSLKLFTNEVALDKKIFFQVGGSLEFNVKEDPKQTSNIFIDDFKLFDSSLLLGVGMEYRMGVSTTAYGGFSYHRGLVNNIADHIAMDEGFILKSDYISLDLGVKF